MVNISETLRIKLEEQQNRIINASERKIVVNAGPGSGKTYTLVKMIERKLQSIPEHKSIIACSFTREASNQLKEKIEMKCDSRQSFIGTIDSFILKEIIFPYKNRFLNKLGGKNDIEKLSFVFPNQNSEANKLTKEGITSTNADERNRYCNQWINKLAKGIYEISFPSYVYAAKMIVDMSIVRDYIESRYECIYIDEAQDMNEYQHKFLEVIANNCAIDVVLIGDKNQSIYQFRGARPELFYELKNKGFTEYEITYSVRCHKTILDFCNLLISSECDFEMSDDVRVELNHSASASNIKKVMGNFMVLCEKNALADDIYGYLSKENIPVILSKKILIGNKLFSDNYYELVEETARFYLNVSNSNPKLLYSIDYYRNFISNYVIVDEVSDRDIMPYDEDLLHYITRMFDFFSISIPQDVILDLEVSFSNPLVINQYTNHDNVNRIMTIHASKGLEAENVFVVLDCSEELDDETKRKLFVAFSRAKNFLFISKTMIAKRGEQSYDAVLEENLQRISIKH